MYKNLKKQTEGFTIIEVLIVLAIAGLIMVVVFLAVPALQRNSRNTQRTNDASRIVAGINECMTNNNGKLDVCGVGGAQFASYIVMTENQQLVNTGGAAVDGIAYATNTKCDSSGSGTIAGGGSRAFTVTYMIETSTSTAMRCVAG